MRLENLLEGVEIVELIGSIECEINDFHFSEWTNVFNQLSGLNTYSVLNNFESSSVEVLQSQHIELLQILMNKSKNG